MKKKIKREEQDYTNYYEILENSIGKGFFGEVCKAKNKKTNEVRAIKVIDKEKLRKQYYNENLSKMPEDYMYDYIENFKNEIKYMKIMEGNNGKNINTVKYYEYFNTEKELVIVMELCDNNITKLFEKKKREEGLNIEEIYNILNQLNNSFKIMNENKIVHRDLKFENILIKYINKENKDKYKVKLADYGISKQLTNFTHLKTKVGTLKYEAPEILKGSKDYNEKCDLWSLGIIIYRLYFKKFPYDGETENDILQSIENGTEILKTNNRQLNDIIKKLLIKEPDKRISWKQYFKHPFFINGINKKYNEINISIEINEYDDINKEIYFLDNTDNNFWINGKKLYHKHDNLKELNESNVELYINKKIMKYKKYFIPKKKGIYEIKLIIKINIKDCSFMFYNCDKIKKINLSSFDTKNVTNMSHMFGYCKNIVNLDLSSFNTKKVTNIEEMFFYCEKLENLKLSTFDTKSVTKMGYIFSYCKNLTSLNISSFDTKNVSDMNNMFSFCEKITNLDLSSFDTKNVSDMSYMFSSCEKITNLDLSSFDTKNVSDMNSMFYNCNNITNLDLSSFDTKNVSSMNAMFYNCNKLKSIKIKKNMNNIFSKLNNKNIEIIQI